jgi:hypothetical protein
VLTIPARHVERPHAELAHVAERHRLDQMVKAGHVFLVLIRAGFTPSQGTFFNRFLRAVAAGHLRNCDATAMIRVGGINRR